MESDGEENEPVTFTEAIMKKALRQHPSVVPETFSAFYDENMDYIGSTAKANGKEIDTEFKEMINAYESELENTRTVVQGNNEFIFRLSVYKFKFQMNMELNKKTELKRLLKTYSEDLNTINPGDAIVLMEVMQYSKTGTFKKQKLQSLIDEAKAEEISCVRSEVRENIAHLAYIIRDILQMQPRHIAKGIPLSNIDECLAALIDKKDDMDNEEIQCTIASLKAKIKSEYFSK